MRRVFLPQPGLENYWRTARQGRETLLEISFACRRFRVAQRTVREAVLTIEQQAFLIIENHLDALEHAAPGQPVGPGQWEDNIVGIALRGNETIQAVFETQRRLIAQQGKARTVEGNPFCQILLRSIINYNHIEAISLLKEKTLDAVVKCHAGITDGNTNLNSRGHLWRLPRPVAQLCAVSPDFQHAVNRIGRQQLAAQEPVAGCDGFVMLSGIAARGGILERKLIPVDTLLNEQALAGWARQLDSTGGKQPGQMIFARSQIVQADAEQRLCAFGSYWRAARYSCITTPQG